MRSDPEGKACACERAEGRTLDGGGILDVADGARVHNVAHNEALHGLVLGHLHAHAYTAVACAHRSALHACMCAACCRCLRQCSCCCTALAVVQQAQGGMQVQRKSTKSHGVPGRQTPRSARASRGHGRPAACCAHCCAVSSACQPCTESTVQAIMTWLSSASLHARHCRSSTL